MQAQVGHRGGDRIGLTAGGAHRGQRGKDLELEIVGRGAALAGGQPGRRQQVQARRGQLRQQLVAHNPVLFGNGVVHLCGQPF